MIARDLGGRRFAVVLSALAFIAVPMYLNDGSVMTTNCLEPLLWIGCVYFAILAIKRDDPRYWLWFGVVAGIGLLDCRTRVQHRCGPLADRAAPRLYQEMDLGRRRARFSGFSSESSLECSESLALCGTHAQHQGRRPRCCAFSCGILRPAGSHRSPDPRADLDHRCARFSFLRPSEAIPVPRLVLSSRVHRIRRFQRQELLSCTNLSSLPGSRSGGDREFHRAIASSLAEACARSVDSRRRSLACTGCHASAPH